MRRITVSLPEDARRALVNLAEREYRDPRDQATKILVDGLREAGTLSKASTESDRPAVGAK